MKFHDTITMDIDGAEANIDLGIVPIVEWINSLCGCRTKSSCEGGWVRPGEFSTPYASFQCDRTDSLRTVISEVRSAECGYVEVGLFGDLIHFVVRMDAVDGRVKLIEHLRKEGVAP